jgi:hypothetical protein
VDDPVGGLRDEALEDPVTQRGQLVRVAALLDHEEDVDLVERSHRLRGDVLGIARPDADHEQPPHVRAPEARR